MNRHRTALYSDKGLAGRAKKEAECLKILKVG
jgi:hypothetical protein